MMLDVEKYGFALKKEWGGTKLYVRIFDKHVSIQLKVFIDGYTLTLKVGKVETMVANAYRCTTQEELDFIIRSGRCRILFSENE